MKHAQHWLLEPGIDFLNHGSFGACPRPVLELQTELRARLEREPVRFFVRELEGLLDAAREELGRFVGAAAADLAFVPNATAGVNTVLRSLALQPGDELLTTDHSYRACRNALEATAERAGARVIVAQVPFPVRSPDEIVSAVLARRSSRTRLALLDHVTSPTAVVFPIAPLVAELAASGVDTLVDGAHAPGMLDLSLRDIGAAYYTGNCHKWLCAPKSVAFLHVNESRQQAVRPLSISHGATAIREGRSRFLLEHDWQGTFDPTPALCIPAAIGFLGSLLDGGWPALRERNHALACSARALLCSELGIAAPCPESMLGSMAAIVLPQPSSSRPAEPYALDPLQDALFLQHGIEVPVYPWPAPPQRLLRISAQLYNDAGQYQKLATTLRQMLAA
ncbi:MAG: aminotransferase class V-fold PLP-dependent enzyme [Polyangiales bacterium]